MGPGKDTHGTLGPARGEAVGGPQQATTRSTARPKDKPIVFSETSAVMLSSCVHTWRRSRFFETADPRRSRRTSWTDSLWAVASNSRMTRLCRTTTSRARGIRCRLMTDTSSTQSKWRSPESSRRPRREKEPITQEKINQVTTNIKISQIQYTDKVVDVSVVMQRQKTLNAELLKNLRGLSKPLSFDGNDTEYSEQKGTVA